MRPFETVLLVLTVAATLQWVVGLRASRRRVLVAAALSVVVFAVCSSLEGIRLQLVPALLLLPVSLLLLWRRAGTEPGTSVPRRSKPVRWAVGGLRFVLLPLAVLLAVVFPVVLTVPDFPEPGGEHSIGVRDFVVRWDERPEILTVDPNDVREVLVRVWYPAEEGSGRPERYMTRAESDAFVTSAGSIAPGGGLLYGHARFADTHSYRDASLVAAEGATRQMPVLVFSHGYTSFLAQNTPLMEELASHGYVVFSIAHTYDGSTVFPDGRVTGFGEHIQKWVEATLEGSSIEEMMAEMNTFIADPDESKRREMLEKQRDQARRDKSAGVGVGLSWDVWLQDRLRFFDVLEELQSGARQSAFSGRLDLDRIGLFGMSFGGATAAEVCHIDARCKAAINLDGGHMYGFDSPLLDADIDKPLLMVYSTDLTSHSVPSEDNPGDFQSHNDFYYEAPETRGTRDDVVRIRIDGTSHLHLSDMSLMVRFIPGVASRIPGSRIAEIMNRYSLAFFDEHLRGQPAPLLDGPSPEFPEVTFQSFGRRVRGLDDAPGPTD